MTEPFRLYWQPGCTSCLKAKEFLAAHGIAFDSINVRAVPGAMAALERLGARSVPVIVQGDRFCFGQKLEEVARFVGVTCRRVRLPMAILIDRVRRLLRPAVLLAEQMPTLSFETLIDGRPDRSYGDIGFHIAMIAEGFLTSARGEELSFDYFLKRPEGTLRCATAVTAQIEATASRFNTWSATADEAGDQFVHTYHGAQPLHDVLERTAWHFAQHCRQLEHIVRTLGLPPLATLGDAELAGLPLPEGVWDKEIGG